MASLTLLSWKWGIRKAFIQTQCDPPGARITIRPWHMPSLLRPVINDVWMGAGVITILSSGESWVSALSDVYLCDLLITRVQWFRSGYAIMGEERAPRLCRELPHSVYIPKKKWTCHKNLVWSGMISSQMFQSHLACADSLQVQKRLRCPLGRSLFKKFGVIFMGIQSWSWFTELGRNLWK